MSTKCEVCGQGPMHGVTVYRTAPKGQAPNWRCDVHRPVGIKQDKVLNELVAIIESAEKVKQ